MSQQTANLLSDLIEPGEPWLGVIRQIVRDPAMQTLVYAAEWKMPALVARFAALRWTHP